MIINKDVHPNKTIFYLAAVLNKILKIEPLNTTDLYQKICKDADYTVDYQVFLLAINFLYLINRVRINEKGEIICF